MAQLFPSLWRALLWEWISCSSCPIQILNLCCLPPGCDYFGFKTSREFCCKLDNFQIPSLEPLCILFHTLDSTHSTFRLQTTSTLPVLSPASLPLVTAERHLHPQHLSCLSCESSIQDLKSRKPPVAHHKGNKESTKCV